MVQGSVASPTLGRGPLLCLGGLGVATMLMLGASGVVLGAHASFLPAYFTLLFVSASLTAVLFTETYRTGGNPRALALAWAYVWTGLVSLFQALLSPGVVSERGLFGATPSSGAWLWAAGHAGFLFFLGLALATWPPWLERWMSGRNRSERALMTYAGELGVVVWLTLLVTRGSGWLPTVADADGYSKLTREAGPALGFVAVTALLVAMYGVSRRSDRVERWALVALVAGACDTLLVLVAGKPFTLGWYGARGLTIAASLIVLVALVNEVTQLHRRARADADRLAEQNNALLQARAVREHISAVVSHDLRSPLQGLTGYLQMLDAEERAGAARADVGVMHAKALALTDRMSRLVDDLSVVSASEHAALAIDPVLVDLGEELDASAAAFPHLDVRLDCPTGLRVRVDPLRLHQVLGNLIANAQRYGAEPVHVRARRVDDDVVIVVRDAGPGVAPELIPTLFERWTRSSTKKSRAGTGLGLSVVRELVEAHDGEVRYDAARRSFEVRLPAPDDPPARRRPSYDEERSLPRRTPPRRDGYDAYDGERRRSNRNGHDRSEEYDDLDGLELDRLDDLDLGSRHPRLGG